VQTVGLQLNGSLELGVNTLGDLHVQQVFQSYWSSLNKAILAQDVQW
jgi:hypothetical protein